MCERLPQPHRPRPLIEGSALVVAPCANGILASMTKCINTPGADRTVVAHAADNTATGASAAISNIRNKMLCPSSLFLPPHFTLALLSNLQALILAAVPNPRRVIYTLPTSAASASSRL